MAKSENFSIRQFRITDRRTYCLFRKAPFQPVLIPFCYTVLRLKTFSLSTVQRKLHGVELLYRFFVERFNEDLDEVIIGENHHRILHHFDEFVNWVNSSVRGSSSLKNYLIAVIEYLEWVGKYYETNADFTNLKAEILELRSKDYYRLPKSFTEKNMELVIEYSNVFSQHNVFNDRNKLRNQLIVQIFHETGIRLSELLKVKASDIYAFEDRYYIEVVNRENEIEDSRSDEPRLKNRQSLRAISISRSLYHTLLDYISGPRRPLRKGKPMRIQHGYLFTSDRGLPLSKRMVSSILETLRQAIIKGGHEFKAKLTPHIFRKNFCERFLKYLIEIEKLDMERAFDEMRTICGWTLNSSMPSHYALKYISENANNHNLKRIDYAVQRSRKK